MVSLFVAFGLVGWPDAASGSEATPSVSVDRRGFDARCGIEGVEEPDALTLRWPLGPMHADGLGEMTFDWRREAPLVRRIAIRQGEVTKPIVQGIDPFYVVTVGTRAAPAGRPPSMSLWNVFFDNPARRPHTVHRSTLERQRVAFTSVGHRATLTIGPWSAGPFRGELVITLYAKTPLVHVEAVAATERERTAYFYDAGLLSDPSAWRSLGWRSIHGAFERRGPVHHAEARLVKHRTILAEAEHGTLAVFPPPHQYQFPRDLSTNLRFVWSGSGYHGLDERFGFGIRQNKEGGGPFVPWVNAPPGSRQRMGQFWLVSPHSAEKALDHVLAFTNHDRLPKLPGYGRMTSHWHMAVAISGMQEEQARPGKARRKPPGYVSVLKDLGVDIIHLADFHGDGHPKDVGPLRLRELEALFDECRRWSDESFLMIPGEEINEFLGLPEPGRHPGHWMSLFPRPVYWIQNRRPDQPFVEEHPRYGTVYRVGRREDMEALLTRERGLAWAAHPRIKASSWTPDVFRDQDFYLAESWFGGAWKAMPADHSHDRLGVRVLDLFNDMANWGQKKYVLGEVDVFKIDSTHELYGHMNINYLRMDKIPRFDNGWQPVLDVLKRGDFFVTTGEVLLPEFRVGGKGPGETLTMRSAEPVELNVHMKWTFPLQFLEIISGDGKNVYRERVGLADRPAFGEERFRWRGSLAGRKWVRVEVWDVAVNGAFTQPVWLERL